MRQETGDRREREEKDRVVERGKRSRVMSIEHGRGRF
jgi:hypothetical protein